MEMTKLEKLLALLRDGYWHSNDQLVQEVGHRFSATMHVAKQQGYRFEKRRVDRQQFEYRLLLDAGVLKLRR